jgi:hypothetical protein
MRRSQLAAATIIAILAAASPAAAHGKLRPLTVKFGHAQAQGFADTFVASRVDVNDATAKGVFDCKHPDPLHVACLVQYDYASGVICVDRITVARDARHVYLGQRAASCTPLPVTPPPAPVVAPSVVAPVGFCDTHACIPSFASGTGYPVECADGLWSQSGGRPGACSGHGGELKP